MKCTLISSSNQRWQPILMVVIVLALVGCERPAATRHQPNESPPAKPVQIRVATYNVEDIRSAELLDESNARLKAAAATIQSLQPDILLINEITTITGEPVRRTGQGKQQCPTFCR